MKKLAILFVAMAALSMFFASVSIANVPAPPVNQLIGFDDTEFNALTEADCRVCHSAGLPDQHHLLYGTAMTPGYCVATLGTCEDGTTECGNDSECAGIGGGTCNNPDRETTVCFSDDECSVAPLSLCANGRGICDPALPVSSECGSSRTTCSDAYCVGNAAATANPNNGVYGCLTCHPEDTSGGVTNFVVERDCFVCHSNAPGTPSVHHLNVVDSSDPAKRECANCHGYVVNSADAVIPTYATSLVTPATHEVQDECSDNDAPCASDADCTAPATCEEVQKEGGCAYCHNAGTDTVSGLDVLDNHDTHHDTGVYKDRFGNSRYENWDANEDGVIDAGGERLCAWCHPQGDGHAANLQLAQRTCANCHDLYSLHSIQTDSDGSGTIVVGGEQYGYGHVGIDTPGGDSDCMGCHSMFNRATAQGSDTITPNISAVTPVVLTAGTPTQITVTGTAFTNDAKTSVIELSKIGADTIVITPDSITLDTITATVNVPVGIYSLRAVKEGDASNKAVIAVVPDTSITITDIETNCGGDCTGTAVITGSGFGDVIPGDEAFLSVMQGAVELTIVSWTDTRIEVSGVMCDGAPITVNALMDSATK